MMSIPHAVADDLPSEAVIFGCSGHMHELRSHVEAALRTHRALLVQGESGTGKQLVARYIHHHSDRNGGQFVPVYCSGLIPDILEGELFGYEDGAFPSVRGSRRGLIEAADGGTLFVANVDEMDWTLQGKLLRLLREGTYRRVGGVVDRRADVRVICGTRVELMTEVHRGAFRQDLFCCVTGLCLRTTALRDRKEDIPMLWDFFAARMARKFKKAPPPMTAPVLRVLMGWYWPGNLRELENGVARVVLLSDLEVLAAELRRELGLEQHRDAEPVVPPASFVSEIDFIKLPERPEGSLDTAQVQNCTLPNQQEGMPTQSPRGHRTLRRGGALPPFRHT